VPKTGAIHMTSAITVGTLIFLCFCTNAVATRPLTDSEKAIISRSVAQDMKDPESAQFRWTPISDLGQAQDSELGGMQVYCGMVNGINSFGGYIGFVPFLTLLTVKNGEVIVSLPVPAPTAEAAARETKLCLEKTGLDPNLSQ
jgi:hypothetical protein